MNRRALISLLGGEGGRVAAGGAGAAGQSSSNWIYGHR